MAKADVIRELLLDGAGLWGGVGKPDMGFNKPPSAAASPCLSERPASATVGSPLPASLCFCLLSPIPELHSDDSLDHHLLRGHEIRCPREPDH